jgi:hypothetical protein
MAMKSQFCANRAYNFRACSLWPSSLPNLRIFQDAMTMDFSRLSGTPNKAGLRSSRLLIIPHSSSEYCFATKNLHKFNHNVINQTLQTSIVKHNIPSLIVIY